MKLPDNLAVSIVNQYIKELMPLYPLTEARSIAHICLEHYCQINKHKLIMEPNIRISESEALQMLFALKALRNLKPVQQLIGQCTFYNSVFFVDENVLIPRPETEQLVDNVLKKYTAPKLKVLDVGTGSACIAVSLKKYKPVWDVWALDISEKALAVAHKNAQANGVDIHFLQLDFLQQSSSLPHDFDLIVSNPPYIEPAEASQMKANVLDYEPHIALFTPANSALIFYEHLFAFAAKQKQRASVYFEINEAYAAQMLALAAQHRFTQASVEKDFFNKDRFFSA